MEEGKLAKRGLHNNLKATIGRHGWVILLSKKLGAFWLPVGGRWVAAISSVQTFLTKSELHMHACLLEDRDLCCRHSLPQTGNYRDLMAGNQKKDHLNLKKLDI